MTEPARLRIYLAGPEVFLPDAVEVGRRKQSLCAEAGFEGVFPLDASLDLTGLSKHEAARRIALANEALIRSCDLMIANLTPFRGASVDSGTAFEIGYMRALGRPVLGYSNVHFDYRRRAELMRAVVRLPFDCDAPGVEIEDYGLAENLMIAVAMAESGAEAVRATAAGETPPMSDLTNFSRCLEAARRLLLGRSV